MNTRLYEQLSKLVNPPLVITAAVTGFMLEFIVELPFRLVLAWSGKNDRGLPSRHEKDEE